jgi:hypothetical protein
MIVKMSLAIKGRSQTKKGNEKNQGVWRAHRPYRVQAQTTFFIGN